MKNRLDFFLSNGINLDQQRERGGKKMWGLPDSAIYGTYKRVSHGSRGRKRTPSIYRDMDKALTKALYAPKKSKVK